MGQRMNAPRIDRYIAASRREPPRRGGPAPIYVVCSPNRQVGKTMLARLLTEHYMADARPVAAFDLADEGPGLADFLAHPVTIPNIRDIRGQVRFFDGLIETGNVPKMPRRIRYSGPSSTRTPRGAHISPTLPAVSPASAWWCTVRSSH